MLLCCLATDKLERGLFSTADWSNTYSLQFLLGEKAQLRKYLRQQRVKLKDFGSL